jgi:dipeptidyl aminopeptidase/acylaminoacyl peptidase
MRLSTAAACVIGVSIAAGGEGRAESPVIRDAAVYGALPFVSEAAISPDGRTLAQIQSLPGGGRAIVFVSLDGQAAPVGMNIGKAKARDIVWAGPEHVLLLASSSIEESFGDGLKTYEIWRWIIIDRAAKKQSVLFNSLRYDYVYSGSGSIKCVSGADSGSVVMAHPSGTELISVKLSSGSIKQAQAGDGNTYDWVLDGECDPVLRVDYNAAKEEIHFYAPNDSGRFVFKSSIKSKLGEFDSISDFGVKSPSGEFAGLAQDGDLMTLRELDIESGALEGAGEGAPGYDVSSVVTDPYANRIVGIRFTDDFARTRFFIEPLKGLQEKADKAFKGASARITSWSKDHSRVVVEVSYADHPDQIFLFNPAEKTLSVIGSAYPKLDGKSQPARSKFDYTASDGVRVPGYLTTPVGASAGPRPLIVLPHGGPAARDDLGFDWWASFYAANGYLVYQPNFRASYGYGEAFRKAGDGQWGRKMQDDISEGVRKLIAGGAADPKRVCIVGASYGGYAALAGATLTPELYACAVSVNGVSNLPVLISSESEFVEKYWTKRIGSIYKDKDSLAAVSPVVQVSEATPPIMLIQSTDDSIVPQGQSLLMRKALESAKRPVTYLALEGEDHWLSKEPTRIEMLEKSLAFIDKHIGPR